MRNPRTRGRGPAAATFGPHGSDTELAWAAGFWDGEGSIGCYYTNPKGVIKASITQNHPEVLERFRRAVAMGYVYQDSRGWSWFCTRYRDIVELCFLLSPRVGSIKRKQMMDALDLYAQTRFNKS